MTFTLLYLIESVENHQLLCENDYSNFCFAGVNVAEAQI